MDVGELMARESIRDLVARYNANGDTGRFAAVGELFAPDAVMIIDDVTYAGVAAIMSIFTTANASLTETANDRPVTTPPTYVRHMTATHQVDVTGETTAKGRCYFQVLTRIGLDHWGRYVDDYRLIDGAWKFARRQVTVDGFSVDSLFR